MKRCFVGSVLMLAMGATGCSHPIGPSVLPSQLGGESPSANPLTTYRVLFDFDKHDGDAPEAALTALNGTLYGTTYLGGSHEGGTVFRMTPSGDVRVFHKFTGADGYRPGAALTVLNGTLYGTTVYGGKYGAGTVFSITTTGKERVLHSFAGGYDGLYPEQRLTVRDGNLYSTTILGGGGSACSAGCGTVFEVSTAGQERVLYRFQGGHDGNSPEAGVTLLEGAFYGTTATGGTSNDGTVFVVTAAGKERVLYSFKGGSDGWLPTGDLTASNDALYGTTSVGGDSSLCHYFGCGIVFKVTPAGREDVLYRFRAGSDGAHPNGGLLELNGTFYGATYQGGINLICHANYYLPGCGTLFKVDRFGTESVLHRFSMGKNGFFPGAGLAYFNGKLYGTTEAGGVLTCVVGSNPQGCGTVFALSP